MKEKESEMQKTIEMNKQNTYEKKNNKNTIPEAVRSNREKEIKEEPTQRMDKFNSRPRKKFNNNRPCRFCNAPNRSPTHKCPALDQRMLRNVTETENPIGEENDKSESSIHRIERVNRIIDRSKYLTTTVKINGTEKEFTIDTGSPNSIKPADSKLKKETEIQKLKHRYQDINKNEVKFRGKVR